MMFRALYDEYREVSVGPRVYELVGRLVRAKARRYPERLYNGGTPWDDDSLSSLHHEVLFDQLLEKGQIHFVFSEPDPVSEEMGYEGVCRRLNFVIGRALSERLRNSKEVEVRLVKRVRKLATSGLLETRPLRRTRYYRSPGSTAEYRDLTDGEIFACANLVHHLPRLVERPDAERQSMGYRSSDLRTVVTIVLEAFGAVSEEDFARIFSVLFTPFGSTALVRPEEDWTMPTNTMTDADLANMCALVTAYVATLSTKELLLVVGKSQGLADEALKETVGASRPTLQKMRERVATGLRDSVLGNVGTDLLDDALDEFAWQCSTRLQAGRQ